MFPTRGFFGAQFPRRRHRFHFYIPADVSIDLGPSCGERFRLGRPSDYACALSAYVHNALIRFDTTVYRRAHLLACVISQSCSCGATDFINKEEACIQV
jgi:hypothetical protein